MQQLKTKINDRLGYRPDSGVFYWKKTDNLAGGVHSSGYWHIKFEGKTYKAHRLAYLIMTGDWPKEDVDHINGNKADNSWLNLRAVSTSENMQNQKRAHKCNKSGLLGVTSLKKSNKWRARITINKKQHFLGMFETAEEAHKAYLNAKKDLHRCSTL